MSTRSARRINVVLDVNVFLDYIGREDGRILLPTADNLPSSSPAADTLALAFDDRYALFVSPHILRNINRVMHANGQSEQTRRKFIEFIVETCELTGGAIVDPVVRDHAIGDHEDNHILALAKDPSVDADVIVSSDHHLIDLGPAWNGRLMIRPRQFTSHMMRSGGQQSAATPAPMEHVSSASQTEARPKARPAQRPQKPTDRFPELRDVQVDRAGLGQNGDPKTHDTPEL
ncbi:putative nucleic acid-binding protein [Microbacterium endophyticum]|uniref:Putative nucleic acid-binding protein n=1 Tax=Microbacterium endophyticum TaxID=1526412 RepID=A0A7W4V1E8_9MICO|nr:PIN domain-containing protein [Microbacterium endophyticum]MBB2975103.1 putative nucleic acid-binding protein [Microbacterium endophyticum]NIK37357.1 putative nucleic acid-binding protein [Microbacterium endophyticum]